MTCSHKAFSDILILALTIRCRGCHNKAGTAFFIQITVEIGNPKIVSVSDFFAFVNTGHTKWQSACISQVSDFTLSTLNGGFAIT